MTRFAPPRLYECPACAGYFIHDAVISLHYYDGMPEWSDGASNQPWMWMARPVGRCPACKGVVWVEDATKLMYAPRKPRPLGPMARVWHRLTGDRHDRIADLEEWAALPDQIKYAERIEGLQGPQDYIAGLASASAATGNRELYLRRRLWWASNDHLRAGLLDPAKVGDGLSTVDAAVAHANMERLLELVRADDKPMERIELLRQLGRFEEAAFRITALPGNHAEAAAQQMAWIKARHTGLKLLKTPHARRSAAHVG